MKLKHEIFIVKIIALTIIIITLWEISALGATRASISRFFMRYNRNLSQKQANHFADLTFEAGAEYHVSPALIAAIIEYILEMRCGARGSHLKILSLKLILFFSLANKLKIFRIQ